MLCCCVDFCKSKFDPFSPNQVQFFNFPCQEDERFDKWIDALGKPSKEFEKEGKFICSKHFLPSDFQAGNLLSTISLLKSAVPTQCLFKTDQKNTSQTQKNIVEIEIDSESVENTGLQCMKTENIKIERNDDTNQENESYCGVESVSPNLVNSNVEAQENITELQDDTDVKENECFMDEAQLQESQQAAMKVYEELPKKFKCSFCEMKYVFMSELKRHQRTTHQNFACNMCRKKFVTDVSLKFHKKTKHKIEYVFHCDECDQAFFRDVDLLKHKRAHEKTANKYMKCEKCKKKYLEDKNLTDHVCERKKRKRNEIRNRSESIETSLEEDNKEEESDKNYCDICNQCFKKPRLLVIHKRNKHDRPFKCDECDKSYGAKPQLEIHKLKHAAIECINLGKMKH